LHDALPTPLEDRAYGFPCQDPVVPCLQCRYRGRIEFHDGMGPADLAAVLQAVKAGNPPFRAAFEHINAETAEFLFDAFAVQVVRSWPPQLWEVNRPRGILSRFRCRKDTCHVQGDSPRGGSGGGRRYTRPFSPSGDTMADAARCYRCGESLAALMLAFSRRAGG